MNAGPLRAGLRLAAGALLAAAMLKGLCVEAYRIPSPSMQPTLLGCDEAATYDRVLVDKTTYLVREPRRWDLAVFHPPLHAQDVYVKRLVGLPGERLQIAGGNLYLVAADGARAGQVEVLRPPADVREQLWREVHPARALVRGDEFGLGTAWTATPPAAWQEVGGELRVHLAPDRPATLRWTCPDGGLVDRIWDGHPLAVARALCAGPARHSELAEIVPDARVAVVIDGVGGLTRGLFTIAVHRPGRPTLQFQVEIAAGSLRAVVRSGAAAAPALASQPVALPSPRTTPLTLVFAHADDELRVWLDGVPVAQLDTAAFDCREGTELPDPCGMGPAMPTAEQCAEVHFELAGSGELALRDLRIWRDQHWTRGPLPANAVLTVPAGHYLLLGDNALQSEDGRGWPSFAVGDRAGEAVPPGTPGATTITGSLLATAGDEPPARDENPIWLPEQRRLACRDRLGNVTVLRADAGEAREPGEVMLRGGDGSSWSIAGPREHFVPREAFVGRAIVRFWPLPPFGPWRPGWLR